MSSCNDAFINNIFTQITNFDSTIAFSLEKRKLKKKWQEAANKRNAEIASMSAFIDSKYVSGHYVQKTYPGIPQDIVDRTIRNKLGVNSSSQLYSSFIVNPFSKRVEGCGDGSPLCTLTNDTNRLCCYCGKGGCLQVI